MSSPPDNGEKSLIDQPSRTGFFSRFKKTKPITKVTEEDDGPPPVVKSEEPDILPVSFFSMFRFVDRFLSYDTLI
jgi:hypothetical protein